MVSSDIMIKCSINKMVLSNFIAIVYLLNNGINAGQVVVLHSPESLGFSSNFGKQQMMLKELYSAALGVSTPQKNCCDWIYFVNPFDAPEAVVEIYVAGVSDVGAFEDKYKVYSMEDQSHSDTYEYIAQKLAVYQTDLQSSKLVYLHLNDAQHLQLYKDIFLSVGNLPETPKDNLSLANVTHGGFLQEVNVLKIIIAALKNNSIKQDNIKDFYHLRFSSMLPLIEKYGSDSAEVLEAKQLLKQHLEDLSDAFVAAYSGEVMVTAVTSDSDKGGYRRDQRWINNIATERNRINIYKYSYNTGGRFNLRQDVTTSETAEGGGVSETTPPPEGKITSTGNITPEEVHLIFWVCFTLGMSLVAIVQVFTRLDPGRDSIVYRLTDTLIRNKVE